MIRTAEISDCGKYRWRLGRRWADGPTVCFVLLNPSTANAEQDDPTIRKCVTFARAWGFSAIDVRNLFPWRTPSPAELKRAIAYGYDVRGGDRGAAELASIPDEADLVIAGWGAFASARSRSEVFVQMIDAFPIWCLAKNADGSPVHPLYQPGGRTPQPFARCGGLEWADALKAPMGAAR